VASLSQGRTAAAQCGLFTYKSVPVIFEPPCTTAIVQVGLYNRPTFPVGTINLTVVNFTPLPLYLPVLFERRLCGLLFRSTNLGQDKFLLTLVEINLSSLSFPACSLVTILAELSWLLLAPCTQLI